MRGYYIICGVEDLIFVYFLNQIRVSAIKLLPFLFTVYIRATERVGPDKGLDFFVIFVWEHLSRKKGQWKQITIMERIIKSITLFEYFFFS